MPHARTTAQLPRLSSRFGYRTDPLRGKVRMHSGIDIPAPLGTPIQASAGGFVRFAGSAGGYGRMIEIAHGDGLTTRYAHLSQILVQPGAPIARGETIALMGSTGRSTGSHLHFEVRDHGRPANPLAYLGGAPLETASSFRGGSYVVWHAQSEPHISQFARARAAAEPSAEK
jgi:murein DD-endopeptidase MepM/ murein hydrolase activator NlpD